MEGNRGSSQRCALLRKIREFTRAIVQDLSIGRSPIVLIDRFRVHCTNPQANCCCSSVLPNGKEILTLQRENHMHRLKVLLRVLLIVQQLLQENRHGSKRDIYYMHPSVFSGLHLSTLSVILKGISQHLDISEKSELKKQSVVDRAINDICILMQCSRHNLNVVSVGNGLVMGWIRFLEGGRKFDCINRPNTAHPIPVQVEEVKDIVSVADYILVVEKESVFERLANDQFCNANRCIVITGRGYPDIPTRRFLRLLIEKLCLPTYCLVDSDPYGFDILTTYRFGSMQMAYDAKQLRCPEVCWLGVFPSDSEKYCLPQQCFLPLTAEDKKKAEAMLNRCYLQREVPRWRLELELMLQRGVKFEIEALSVHSLSFLSKEYITSKIQAVAALFCQMGRKFSHFKGKTMCIGSQLLQENRHGSKRDIYYMHPSVFSGLHLSTLSVILKGISQHLDISEKSELKKQSVVDRAINDICILMQCSRHNLNVVSVGNGLVMGWIRFLEGGRKFDCINRPNTAHPIPVQVEEVKDIVSVADYILVVEKESVFERLANDQFCNANRCIVITGRGHPDIPTRRFLRLLIEKLCLPTYCLVDCDPYGFDILTTYRFGSMQMAYDAKQLRCPEVCWLGVFPSDSEKYCLPEQCFLPLTAEDKKKAETMLNRCYLQREVPRWRLELELMLQRGVKFEIEALSVHSLSFLSKEYITSKIQGGVHI